MLVSCLSDSDKFSTNLVKLVVFQRHKCRLNYNFFFYLDLNCTYKAIATFLFNLKKKSKPMNISSLAIRSMHFMFGKTNLIVSL